MPLKKSGLGRGLDALIPTSALAPRPGVLDALVDHIHPNPRQPRTHFDPAELQELAASIQSHGVIQPLIVTRGERPDDYTLVAGERRLQAARLAGLASVPVIVREASEQQMVELALIENVQRADLNPLEAAEAYRQLTEEFGLSHEEVSTRVGKSRAAVSNTLRLLKLASSVQQSIVDGRISEGHARALLGLPTHQAQAAVLQTILSRELNVRQTEELVRRLSGQRPAPRPKAPPDPHIQAVEERLRLHLGTRVRLHHGPKGGSIMIHYYSDEELENLIRLITGD